MVDAAFHLASGRDWLGFKVPRPLRVLIIENEGPQEMFRRKLEAKAAAWFHEIRGAIFVHTFDWGGLDMRDKEQRRRLREHIAEYRIDLVFGDPLDSCGLEGVGSPEDTRAFMALAQEVGLHRTVAFCFLHHVRKERTDDDVEALSGAWGGRPDTVLVLSALAGQRSRLAVPKVRWSRRGKRPALILGFDPEIEGFDFVGEEGEERDYAAEIAALLSDNMWRTVDEIAAPKEPKREEGKEPKEPGIGASRTTIKKTLEGNPERFVRKPGDEVGRHANAQVWGLT
jgi:AAA domain